MLQPWQIVAVELAFPGCSLRSHSGSLYHLRGEFAIDGINYDSATLFEVDGDVFDAMPGDPKSNESWRGAIRMLALVREALSLSGHERIEISGRLPNMKLEVDPAPHIRSSTCR